jgi:hypothetical protein
MRHFLLLTLCALYIPLAGAVSAQSIRTASPTVTPVQLSSFEPAPPGVPLDIFYGGLGGGGEIGAYIPPVPTWYFTPGVLTFPGGTDYFSACGYRSSAPAQGTLTLPSGSTRPIVLNEFEDGSLRCFDYRLPFSYGTELGLYTLTLTHPDGNLSHTFGLEYPQCWMGARTDNIAWVMGLEPNQQLTLYFYSYIDRPGGGNFVAQRTARADAEGVLALDIQVARTAPFTRDDVYFVPTGVGRTIIDYEPELTAFQFEELGFVVSTFTPPETYPHNRVFPAVYIDADVRGRSCDGEFDQFAQVYSPQGRTVTLSSQPNGSDSIATLREGAVVEILEYRPLITDGRVFAWKQVRAENGLTGWTHSSDFVRVFADDAPGVRARLLPSYRLQNGAHYPTTQTLYTSDGGVLGQFNAGTEVTLIQRSGNMWQVRLDDGTIGRIAIIDPETLLPAFTTLPWAATAISSAAQPTRSSVVCAGSPPPRLAPGIRARVLPGDPNNIRVQPESGRVIGQIPSGAEFRVLAGPSCGANTRLTWWEVEYNGVVGWTAEGRGSEYWLEPIG